MTVARCCAPSSTPSCAPGWLSSAACSPDDHRRLIDFMRVSYASPPMDDVLRDRGIACEEHVAPGHLGDPLQVSVLRPPGQDGPRPAVVYAHSGGLMFGDRFSGIDLVLDWVDRMGAFS